MSDTSLRMSRLLGFILCTTALVFSARGNSESTRRIDLSHWNLTLPTGRPKHPDVIKTSELVSGYSSDFFHSDSDGALIFWCPVTGVTTGGTKYPRSELRETRPDGSLVNWHVTDGTASIKASLAILQVPGNGRMTIGQIHNDGNGGIKSEPLLKLVYKYSRKSKTGALVAQVRSTPTAKSNSDSILLPNVGLGEPFSYEIKLRSTLDLAIRINGNAVYEQKIDASWKDQGLYFKAGAYVHDTKGTSKDGGRAKFSSLEVSHQ